MQNIKLSLLKEILTYDTIYSVPKAFEISVMVGISAIKLIQIIEKENPAAIIIGMPEASKGQVNSIVEFIKECIVELQKYAIPEIIFHDESFSSKDAVSHMVHSGISKKKRAVKGRIDQTAAAIILRSFLDEYGL